jgi:uncharacterized protein YjiS (DUF1127 family)
MTSMTVSVAGSGRAKHQGSERMTSLLRRLAERYRAATSLRQLETMSDWQLKDVGLDRCGIRHGISLRRTRNGHARD